MKKEQLNFLRTRLVEQLDYVQRIKACPRRSDEKKRELAIQAVEVADDLANECLRINGHISPDVYFVYSRIEKIAFKPSLKTEVTII